MIIRTADIQATGSKCGIQVVKQPIASGKSANKENGLCISCKMEWSSNLRTYRYFCLCAFALTFDHLDNSSNRWFKKFSNISSTKCRQLHLETEIKKIKCYPCSFNWPDLMFSSGALSLNPPNLMNWASSGLTNLNLVVLSNLSVMIGISLANFEPLSRTMYFCQSESWD